MIKLINKSPFLNFFPKPYSTISISKVSEPKPNFMKNYLISSYGFSPKDATTKSRLIAHINSTENPNSVNHFLKHIGFTENNIKSIVSCDSRILSTNVEDTLEPNYKALRKIGYFSDTDLHKIIVHHPRVLSHSKSIPRLEFWRSFLNGDDRKLMLAFVRNIGLVGQDTDKGIGPKIVLLNKYGLTKDDIGVLLVKCPGLFWRSVGSMEILMKRLQELGFACGSSLFVRGLTALSGVGIELFNKRIEIFKSCGWSEEEFLSAFRKDPFIIRLSDENIREKMDFFYEKAGCEKSYIIFNPSILGFSLEKRLMPRHCIMKILRAKNLAGCKVGFYTMVCFSEKKFIDTFIIRNVEKVPELHDIYAVACACQVII